MIILLSLVNGGISQTQVKPMIAYLSGAMEHAEDEGAGWRQELANWLKNQLNHDSIDPVKASQEIIETYKIGDYRSWKTSDPERFSTVCSAYD